MFERSANLEMILCEWLTHSLSDKPSEGVVAYCVNLYDSPFRAELVGAGRFDPDDEDWACDELWAPERRHVDLPEEYASLPWEQRLELCTGILRRYVMNGNPASKILSDAEAVAIGFVDGNLNVVSRNAPGK